MSEPVIPPKAKLFIGILFTREEHLSIAEKDLFKKYGEIDFQTKSIPFTHTKYYSDMGSEIFKIFFSFKKLIKREDIIKIKIHTNNLEKKISANKERKINIDPGYLTLSNVFLATGKEYFHRTYLGKGIYLENEYKYVGRHFQPWEWTYPDYIKEEYLYFFHEIRKIYHMQLKGKR